MGEDFSAARENLENVCSRLYDHLLLLDQSNKLTTTFGKALLDFGKISGITRKDVENEINLMLVAGHETTG